MKINKWKKWLKRIGLGILVTLVLLTGLLAIHIYQVSKRPKGGVDSWQMARVDFEKSIDSIGIYTFRNALHQQKAVFHSYVNNEAGTLAFAYDPSIINASHLCNTIVEQTDIKARLLHISNEDVANACPVIDKNSITYRISSGFQKLFQ